jgi:phosphate transport system substrate-binding protein
MTMKTLSKTVLAALTCLTAALPGQAKTITTKGSDTLVILAQKWAEVYMAGHPGVKIQVNGGG